MSTRDALLKDIETFLVKHAMDPTAFSIAALGVTDFVHRLRRGRDPRGKTIDRVREFMKTYRPPARVRPRSLIGAAA